MSEYRPTEFIVDFGDYRSNQSVRLNMALIEQNSAKLGESVVRCMDCRHYSDHEWVIATDVEHVCHFWHGEPTKVAPDGFCAWGWRRDA